MSWSLANPWMLLGLLGMAIPIVIHVLDRRRVDLVDWGAMQFLEIAPRVRQRVQLVDALLLAGRMLLLGLVALALARPAWSGGAGGGGRGSARRDVVLVLDGSDSMARRAGDTTPHQDAVAWVEELLERLAPGSTVGLVLARDRVATPIDPPTADLERVAATLRDLPPPRGSSDLPAAIAEALRLLDASEGEAREIVLLTDGQNHAWRPDEPARWSLLRDLHADQTRRAGVAARLWAVNVGSPSQPDDADGSIVAIDLARGLVPPMLPVTVRATVANAGPGELTRTAELLVDGAAVPGSAQVVGPIPSGGRTPLEFRATLAAPGAHALAVRLAPDGRDPLPANDEGARVVEVVEALPVLLVDGEPGREPFSGEVDFLRAALAPTADEAPHLTTTVVRSSDLAAADLDGPRVVVLANVDRLEPEIEAALGRFVARGNGLLVAIGDRTDGEAHDDRLAWLPAAIGPWRGDLTARAVIAHPAPASFAGGGLAPLARGDEPPLASAGLFAYRLLTPAARPPAATVLARLDSGDPWIVERPYAEGRVILLAGPLDAEGGTLPVNPDFVPLAHELIFHLADPASRAREVRPGEPILVELDVDDGAIEPGPVVVAMPTGEAAAVPVATDSGRAQVRIATTAGPGLYRFDLPGGPRYVAVAADPREWDPTPLPAEAATTLAEGWPMEVSIDRGAVAARMLESPGASGRNPIWRGLVLVALAGLGAEVLLTRRIIRGRGLGEGGREDG